MQKKNVFSLCCCIAFVCIIVLCVLAFRYFRERYEYDQPIAWKETITQEFYHRFLRPLDVVNQRYYALKTKDMSLDAAVRFIQKDLTLYETDVKKGERHAHKSSIIIAGLIMNGAHLISEIKARCYEIVRYFREYKILIIENDSVDNTRQFLLEWSAEDPNIVILCQDPYVVNSTECIISQFLYSGTVADNSPRPERISRMAFLRNVYMNHIRQYYPKFDYLCVLDLDLHGDLFIDGFLHSISLLTQKNIDAVSCNGMIMRENGLFYYYDSFAFIDEHEPIMWENMTDKSNHDNWVHLHVTHRYTSQMMPDKVQSAFGGLTLYKLPVILNNVYGSSPHHFSCEHSFFHNNINIWVNPRFIFLIEKNG